MSMSAPQQMPGTAMNGSMNGAPGVLPLPASNMHHLFPKHLSGILFPSVFLSRLTLRPQGRVNHPPLCLQCRISSTILEQLLCTSPQMGRHERDYRSSRGC